MIVDFPSEPRRQMVSRGNVDKCSYHLTVSKEECRRVSFMNNVETKFIGKRPQEDIQATWYSRKERKGFEKDAARDIWKLREKIAMTECLSKEDECRCTGLEIHLAKGLKQVVYQKRIKHRYAVLEEQQKQLREGQHDANRLARVSRKMSKWARATAHEFGRLSSTHEVNDI